MLRKRVAKFTVLQSSVLKCFHAVGLWQRLGIQIIHLTFFTTGGLHEALFCSELDRATSPRLAVRVTHSAVTDSSEKPTLAEGTVIAAHTAR